MSDFREIIAALGAQNPDALLLEPRSVYDPCVVGMTDEPDDHWPRTGGTLVAVYSAEKCIETTRTLGKDDWMTPPEVFDPVNQVAQFDLDACATNLDAARVDPFIDPKTDALRVRWADYGRRVWCNPPYGRDIRHWFEKAAHACLDGCELVVLLAYANTDTTYWREYVARHPMVWSVVFLTPRVKFVRPDGEPATGAPKGSALICYSHRPRPSGSRIPHAYWDYKYEPFTDVIRRTAITHGAT